MGIDGGTVGDVAPVAFAEFLSNDDGRGVFPGQAAAPVDAGAGTRRVPSTGEAALSGLAGSGAQRPHGGDAGLFSNDVV
ncbi:MAG: hypothetical protein LBC94_07735 [Desulfovibrio sp.]|nr:hypothetical protein [Desulfovibrio sp.]